MRTNPILKKSLSVGIVFWFMGTSVCMAQHTFYPSMDTMIVENGPNNNFGTNPTMEVRNSGSSGTGWEEDALVRFNLSSLQPGTPISHATLFMFYSHFQDNDPASRTLTLYQITSEWNENTVTWNTRPTTNPIATSTAMVPSSPGVWMQWDVTKDVQDIINGNKTNYGWRLRDEQFWGGFDIPRTHYCTKENSYNIPNLNITLQDDGITFYSSMDTMIVENGPNNNFGTNPTMEVRNSGTSRTGWEEDALVRFNLSSIPPGNPIEHATLLMFYSHFQDNDPASRIITLYQITSEWNENTVTWNTRPTTNPIATSTAMVPSSPGVWMQWDVTKDVQDFVSGNKTNYGWRLIDEQYWGGLDIPRTHFWTKENGKKIPSLKITLQNENLSLSFLAGKIKNLSTQDDVVTFDAVHLKMVSFIPFSINTYTSGETITVEGHKLGVITMNFIFGFFKATI
jgi:hypothetical protein